MLEFKLQAVRFQDLLPLPKEHALYGIAQLLAESLDLRTMANADLETTTKLFAIKMNAYLLAQDAFFTPDGRIIPKGITELMHEVRGPEKELVTQ